ncbi:Pkinase-fungal domain-containing protein [Mycena chlorophos]|uniref:Pkinase-fungal domain-containing protein n=1 Tax=Mycena chlorophos TaxID=658473 RepID=A0A8H6SET1_MYCCL|nr:Pkinase-fungal domain-containing protein [Mycena chlorophos]
MTYAASDFTVHSDDTISRPTADTLDKLWAALDGHQYLRVRFPKKVIENECLRLVAARRTQATGLEHRQPEPEELIHCLTIGPPLFVARSDSESKRATHVYRVVVEEDLDNNAPLRVYALKDVWHEIGRREEVDFYDLVARHCVENGIDMEKAGMARCHGNLNLARPGPHLVTDWDLASHGTAKRHHTRILLSPVGRPIHEFPSTKKLVEAFHAAVIHLKIAYDAGVLHRDVSANNVLLVEDPSSNIPGFLVDYDCAEMTENGVKLFNAWFNTRTPASWKESNKSLLDRTGTFPFMAIERIEAKQRRVTADHSSEGAVDSDADIAHPNDYLAC